jgi:hypothetical protein
VGVKLVLPLDVTVQPLLEWAQGHDCPDALVTPVRRSLEADERT